MHWARETKEMGYLRVGFSRGFQRRIAVAGLMAMFLGLRVQLMVYNFFVG
jgi:hypothetical protein